MSTLVSQPELATLAPAPAPAPTRARAEEVLPVVAEQARQGDILVDRIGPARPDAPTRPIKARFGRRDGHKHVLAGTGCRIQWGVYSLPTGGELRHPEHGTLILSPGTWRVTRQRQYRAPAPD